MCKWIVTVFVVWTTFHTHLHWQKVTEALFKELNLTKDNNIDKDAMLKYVDRVKEANWKPVMKAAVEECYKEVIAKKDDIAKELAKAPFNIKPDQCNSLFMAMITCVHLEGFEVISLKSTR